MGTTVPRLAALSGFRYALHVDDDAALTCHPTSGDSSLFFYLCPCAKNFDARHSSLFVSLFVRK